MAVLKPINHVIFVSNMIKQYGLAAAVWLLNNPILGMSLSQQETSTTWTHALYPVVNSPRPWLAVHQRYSSFWSTCDQKSQRAKKVNWFQRFFSGTFMDCTHKVPKSPAICWRLQLFFRLSRFHLYNLFNHSRCFSKSRFLASLIIQNSTMTDQAPLSSSISHYHCAMIHDF